VAFFVVWLAFWIAGGLFGPVQYHPPQPAPGQHLTDPVEHEAIGR
jgi:hypothetical protein